MALLKIALSITSKDLKLCFLNVCFVASNTPGSSCLSFCVQRTREHLGNAVCAGRSPANQPVLLFSCKGHFQAASWRWRGESWRMKTFRISSTAFPFLPGFGRECRDCSPPHRSSDPGGSISRNLMWVRKSCSRQTCNANRAFMHRCEVPLQAMTNQPALLHPAPEQHPQQNQHPGHSAGGWSGCSGVTDHPLPLLAPGTWTAKALLVMESSRQHQFHGPWPPEKLPAHFCCKQVIH